MSEPAEVKMAIANKTTSNSDKQNYVNRYGMLCEANGIEWKRPYYPTTRTPPKIPTREAIMKIITETGKYAPIFKTLAETGLMPYELSKVPKEDINTETRTLTAKGFKGHLGRTFKLTEETIAMLNNFFARNTRFPTSEVMTHTWIRAKHRVAETARAKHRHHTALRSTTLLRYKPIRQNRQNTPSQATTRTQEN